MAFEHGDPMRKALAARRGKGLDISILVGSPDDDKKTDLAPKPDAHSDVAQDKELIHQELAKHDSQMGDAPMHDVGPVGELHDGDILKGMSDYDKSDMAGRAPRSLMERARQEAMQRMGKK